MEPRSLERGEAPQFFTEAGLYDLLQWSRAR